MYTMVTEEVISWSDTDEMTIDEFISIYELKTMKWHIRALQQQDAEDDQKLKQGRRGH